MFAANGTAAGPSFVHPFDATGFHIFDGGSPTGDRFNFSPYNLLLTPSQRTGLFTQVRRDVGLEPHRGARRRKARQRRAGLAPRLPLRQLGAVDPDEPHAPAIKAA